MLIHEKKISVWPPGWSTSCAITENLGIKLENIELDDLGRAKKIVVGKDNTTIVEGVGKSSAIEGRIEQIRAQLDETTSAARRPLGRLGAYKRRSARTGLVSMKAWPPC